MSKLITQRASIAAAVVLAALAGFAAGRHTAANDALTALAQDELAERKLERLEKVEQEAHSRWVGCVWEETMRLEKEAGDEVYARHEEGGKAACRAKGIPET
jgi:hypothetical protein